MFLTLTRLIAIMLAKLRMSVEEATEAFKTIADDVYTAVDITPLERSQRLTKCMKAIMKKRKLRVGMKLRENTETECSAWYGVPHGTEIYC